jgi:DNA-binding beta-propeller fold protein YncE
MMHRCLGSVSELQLYVADFNNHRVEVFNPIDGTHIRSIGQGRGAEPGKLVYPKSCTALSGGGGGVSELYISEFGNHRVSVFDIATGAFRRHIGAGQGTNAGQMDKPQGIALSLGCVDSQRGDHLLYVSDYGNDRIQIFNARTGAHVGFLGVGELDRPCGIRLHAATGNRSLLFVSEWSSKRIRVYEV